MAIKAELKVLLKAGEHVVAESDDPRLWQQVFARIYGAANPEIAASEPSRTTGPASQQRVERGSESAIDRLATMLDLSPEQLNGACRPALEEPFLTLDLHCWKAYRRGTPARGRGAIGGTAVVGTLLALWAREAELPCPTLSNSAKVLLKVGFKDTAPRRTVRNCIWLQLDGKEIKLNLARVSSAEHVARAFILSQWSDYSVGESANARRELRS